MQKSQETTPGGFPRWNAWKTSRKKIKKVFLNYKSSKPSKGNSEEIWRSPGRLPRLNTWRSPLKLLLENPWRDPLEEFPPGTAGGIPREEHLKKFSEGTPGT